MSAAARQSRWTVSPGAPEVLDGLAGLRPVHPHLTQHTATTNTQHNQGQDRSRLQSDKRLRAMAMRGHPEEAENIQCT